MRASHGLYKASKIISIIFLVFMTIGVIGGIICISAILNTQSFPVIINGQRVERAEMEGMLVYLIVLGVIGIAVTIVNLVLSIKAPKENKKGLHIASIVFGVLSGVIFDIPAAIIALKEGSKKPEEKPAEPTK